MRRFLFFGLLCLLALPVLAQKVDPNGNNMPPDHARPNPPVDWRPSGGDMIQIDLADLIVIGTVTDVTIIDGGVGQEMKRFSPAEITIQVDDVLKGGKAEKMTFMAPNYNPRQPIDLKKQGIFALKRASNGYALPGMNAIIDASKADKVKERLAASPLKISIDSELGFCPFGNNLPLSFTVTNKSDKPVQIQLNTVSTEAFIYSPLIKESLQVTLAQDADGAEDIGRLAKPMTLEAGAQVTGKYTVRCSPLRGFSMLTPDTFLRMPAAFRINVRTLQTKDDKGILIPDSSYMASSPWKTIMIGYALPDDAVVDEAAE